MSERDPVHVQAYRDSDNAFSIAKAIWKAQGQTPTPEVLRETAADVMVHIRELRRSAHQPAGRAVPGKTEPGRPAPSPAPAQGGGDAPVCSKCQSALQDVRASKKNPKGPDYICSNKSCKEGNYRTGYWERDIAKMRESSAYVGAAKIRQQLDDFADKPEALDGDEDDLPF